MTDKARELLERAMESLDGGFLYRLELKEEIRDFLSTPEPTQDEEPVAWTSQEQLAFMEDPRFAECEMYMWKSPGKGMINIPLYLHPAPRPEFVRLSEEEIVSWWGVATEAGLIEFARAIEDALEEKNRG